MRYRLIGIQTSPVTLYNFPKTVQSGHVVSRHYMTLHPNETYFTDDAAQVEYLKRYSVKVRYNPSLEAALKRDGIPYEVVTCRTCGGKVKKIKYSIIEILAD